MTLIIPRMSNVLTTYAAASADDLREGLAWYNTAHRWCESAARGRSNLIARNAGIVAALSPMNEWENNKNKAQALISARGRITIDPVTKANGIGLSANVAKAQAIYNGMAPLEVLGGNKVRAFYATILDPTASDIDPVIDRHAFDIAVGMVTDDKTRRALDRVGVYHNFAMAYRNAAREVGIGASQMQAVTWITWRRLKATK